VTAGEASTTSFWVVPEEESNFDKTSRTSSEENSDEEPIPDTTSTVEEGPMTSSSNIDGEEPSSSNDIRGSTPRTGPYPTSTLAEGRKSLTPTWDVEEHPLWRESSDVVTGESGAFASDSKSGQLGTPWPASTFEEEQPKREPGFVFFRAHQKMGLLLGLLKGLLLKCPKPKDLRNFQGPNPLIASRSSIRACPKPRPNSSTSQEEPASPSRMPV